MNQSAKRIDQDPKGIEEAFPSVDPGIEIFGSRVLVQIREAKKKTASGLYLVEETKRTDKDNMQVAKVIGVGPLAFHNRDTMKEWPEGSWCKVGEFVRVPKYGGDRFEVPHPQIKEDRVTFAIFNDLDIIGRVTCDPLSVIAFV